ncbi:MAG: T9SS type A sorting domain-containing protein [Cyclonatronaceae bacterium]
MKSILLTRTALLIITGCLWAMNSHAQNPFAHPANDEPQVYFDLTIGTERHYHDCAGLNDRCLTAYGVNGLATEIVIGETEIDGITWAKVAWAKTMDYWPEDPDAFVVYDTAFYRTDGPLLYKHTAGGDSLIFDFRFAKGDSILKHFLPFIPGEQDPEWYIYDHYRYVDGELPSVVLFDTTIAFPDGLHRRIVWGDDTLRTQFGDYYPIIDASVFVDSLETFMNLPLPRYFIRPFYYIEGMGVLKTPVNHRHMNMSGFKTSDGMEFGQMNEILDSSAGDPQIWFDLSVGTVRYYGDCAIYGPCLTAYGVNGLAIESVIAEKEIDGITWAEVAWEQTMDYWPEDPDAFVVYDTAFYRTDGPLLFMHTDQGDSLILDFDITKGDSLVVHFSRFIPEGLDMESYVGLYYRLEGMPALALVDTTITFPDGTDWRIVWGEDIPVSEFDTETFMKSFMVEFDNIPMPGIGYNKPFYFVEGMGAMHTPINHRHMNMVGYSTPDGAVYGNKHDDFLVSVPGEPQRPAVFTLHQNYPNPFNPSTVIRYELPEGGHVHLAVYDMTGRRVAELVNGPVQSGSHTAGFDGSRLASGVYVYRLQSGGQVLTGKMMLVK